MSFDIDKCKIKKVWCGKGKIPNNNEYIHRGSRYECLQQGIGAGIHQEKKKHLPPTSLKLIPYIGDDMESKLKKAGIKNTTDLVHIAKKLNKKSKEKLLKSILQNKNQTLNGRAYNSIILYLYTNGVLNLPDCLQL